jgi:oligopeptidase A
MKYVTCDGLQLPDWESFSLDAVLEDIEQLLVEDRRVQDIVATDKDHTFESLVLPLEECAQRISLQMKPVLMMHALKAHMYADIESIVEKLLVRLADHSTRSGFHQGVYIAYKQFQSSDQFALCTSEQKYIIEQKIRSFERNGIHLVEEKRERVIEIKKRLTELANTFTVNVRKATEAYVVLAGENDVGGLPDAVIAQAKKCAEKEKSSPYAFSLKSDVASAVLAYADSRSLRERMWYAYSTRASDIGPIAQTFDNSSIMQEMLVLRHELAQLLGHVSFAELSLDAKMTKAIGVSGVEQFLTTIAHAAKKTAAEEESMLLAYALERDGIKEFSPWDRAYYAELYQKEHYRVDTEEIRLYFPLEKVFSGIMTLMQRLFRCSLREQREVSTWHNDVRFYELIDESGAVCAGFYVDLFARDGKRGGAWMNEIIPALHAAEKHTLPVAYLAGNFRQPDIEGRVYLDHGEIETLFHEFGHVLHHLFAKTSYSSSEMMNVEWDAVELPSQFFENWCFDTALLKDMSAHKETQASIPDDLILNIQKTRRYLSGYMYARQMTFALMDLWAHSGRHQEPILQIYKDAAREADPRPVPNVLRHPHVFTHIFDVDGYEAGYFSYTWANGLVANVQSAFEHATNEQAVAEKYRQEILSVGASRPFMDSFIAFCGKEPDPSLLISYLGLHT